MNFDIMGGLSAFGGGLAGYIVPFLFVLTIVVFFHELGHFLVARMCGIKVLAFSIGFGPEIIGFYDRYGTRWKIAAVPLGGYVKFFGDDNAASVPDQGALAAMTDEEKKDSFANQKVGPRAAVVVAGPVANFILAIAIFAVIFMIYGKQTTSARVDAVQANSAASAAGFKPGDLVVAIDGGKIASFSDMQRIVSVSAGEALRSRSSATASWSRSKPHLLSSRSRMRLAMNIASAYLALAGRCNPAISKRKRSIRCAPLEWARKRLGSSSIARCHISAVSLPAGRRPTNSVDRSALLKCPDKLRPQASRRLSI